MGKAGKLQFCGVFTQAEDNTHLNAQFATGSKLTDKPKFETLPERSPP